VLDGDPTDDGLDEVADELLAAAVALAGKRVAVLTGAGVSTESGIPDYRGPETRKRARQPMRFAQFMSGDDARKRYWARATRGWPRVRDAQPNAAHEAIARFPSCVGVITQNVDGLHTKAGSARVVELHGALADVVCLACSRTHARADVHARTLAANPHVIEASHARGDADVRVNPDGDVEIADHEVATFVVPACACGGALKPRVVFFGENVPQTTVDDAWHVLSDANALLVVGTSLEVYSGRRFVIEAHKRALPIVIVNDTETRADDLATVIVRARAGHALPRLLRG
jgi:NAD-dependent SIR2 family protein deacetylase